MAAKRSLEEEFGQERKRRARDSFHQAFRLQRQALADNYSRTRIELIHTAISYYRRSIEFFPMAETYTFMGWAFSLLGALGEAIASCQQAIALDPEYGNPYNDIGVYLIELGNYDQAVPYLQKAIVAKRYDCQHYAHYNLGRIWLVKGHLKAATYEFKKALEYEPTYILAQLALKQLQAGILAMNPEESVMGNAVNLDSAADLFFIEGQDKDKEK
ncbi:MAG: tetratricopeptide repeat protein [Cyanobacteria bacterium NC_groundwater_1444_Ag_S-0.65um_54_12]|nr:tetratricopeptide repeat protein [Cyanobacteria bacterium NC_groundwater_1444_Ag_S-0.65um_54_12]